MIKTYQPLVYSFLIAILLTLTGCNTVVSHKEEGIRHTFLWGAFDYQEDYHAVGLISENSIHVNEMGATNNILPPYTAGYDLKTDGKKINLLWGLFRLKLD